MPGPTNIISAVEAKENLRYKPEFDAMYAQTSEDTAPEIKALFQETTSDGASEDYHLYDDVGKPIPWERGEGRAWVSFGDQSHNIVNKRWQHNIGWHEEDEEDQRVQKSFATLARAAGRQFGYLDERVANVLLTATADVDTLAAVPTCFDGYALFSASHTGRTGGNIVTQVGGVATTEGIGYDWDALMQAISEVTMPNSGLYRFRPGDLNRAKFYIYHAYANRKVFREWLYRELAFATDSPNGLAPTVAAAVSNIDKRDFENRVKLVPWQQLSGNDWIVYMELPGETQKPLLKQNRKAPRMVEWTMENSDHTKGTLQKGVGWDARLGYGYMNFWSIWYMDES